MQYIHGERWSWSDIFRLSDTLLIKIRSFCDAPLLSFPASTDNTRRHDLQLWRSAAGQNPGRVSAQENRVQHDNVGELQERVHCPGRVQRLCVQEAELLAEHGVCPFAQPDTMTGCTPNCVYLYRWAGYF